MRLSIIVAVAENGVIGRGGTLPWRLSDDLKRFKRLTMGHTIIMGRRTWESIARPLPGRHMVVVTRQPNYRIDAEGITVAHNLDDALQDAADSAETETFIIGGAELYKAALARTGRLYVTVVKAAVEGDTYFPIDPSKFDWNEWVVLENEPHEADDKNEYPYVYTTLQRCEPTPAAD